MKDVCDSVTEPGLDELCKGCGDRLKCLIDPKTKWTHYITAAVTESLKEAEVHKIGRGNIIKATVQSTLDPLLNEGRIRSYRNLLVEQSDHSFIIGVDICQDFLLEYTRFVWQVMKEL